MSEKELVEHLYVENQIDSLLEENGEVEKKREEVKKYIGSLKECIRSINEFEDKH